MISVLSMYRGTIFSDRGTSIRIKSVINELLNRGDLILHTATWDSEEKINHKRHIFLPNKHLRELVFLISYIRKNKIDFVIGHTISSIYYALLIKIFTRAHLVLEMHGFLEEEEYLYGSIGKINYLFKKNIYSFLYKLFDLITVCSETTGEYLNKYNKSIVVVYGGFDEKIFFPQKITNKFDKKLVIGYAGNARIWQGLDFLLETLDGISDKNFELRILCSEKKWKLDHKYHHFAKLYEPLPYSEVPKFLAECDILVVPRLDNIVNRLSFPSKLIEYMAMGKPVIASKTSDCHKIIDSGVDGLLYDPGDKKAFTQIIWSLGDFSYRQKIGQNALEKVSNFTWDKQVDIIVNKLKNICQNKTGKKIL